MNAYEIEMMDAPSLLLDWCARCGSASHVERHHVVRRSQGGHAGPLIALCRSCHNQVHDRRLHLKHEDGRWWALATTVATKYDAALSCDEWRAL